MGDHTLPPRNTLVVGMTGSGKTTFVIKYLLNANVVCRFIFDDLGRYARRLKINPARTLRQCEESLATRWVVYNPHTMFPGNPEGAFDWFSEWSFEKCKGGPGPKIFVVDEAGLAQTSQSIPRPLKTICRLEDLLSS